MEMINCIWKPVVDILLLFFMYQIQMSCPTEFIFVIIIFTIRYLLTELAFSRFKEKIVTSSKKSGDLKYTRIIFYVGLYFILYIFENIIITVSHVTEEERDNDINLLESSNSNSDEEKSEKSKQISQSNSEYEVEIVVIEEEEEEEQNEQMKQNMMQKELNNQIDKVDKKEKLTNFNIEEKVSKYVTEYFWIIHSIILVVALIIVSLLSPIFSYPDEQTTEKFNDKDTLKLTRKIIRTTHFPQSTFFIYKGEGSNTPNAFITGFKSKNVFLSDALVKNFAPEEIAAVIGHEIGHWYNKDDIKLFVVRTIPYVLYSIFLQYISKTGLYEFGYKKGLSIASMFFVCAILYDYILKFCYPIFNIVTREGERNADCFSTTLNLQLANVLIKFNKTEEMRVTPKIVRIITESHPSTDERLENLYHCRKKIWPKVITNKQYLLKKILKICCLLIL